MLKRLMSCQVAASELFGGQEIHSTHGVHPKAPNKHIFRLSNDQEHGILGVGPQWHNDGSFERAVFSHVGYHIVRVPENGGATRFCHQGSQALRNGIFGSLSSQQIPRCLALTRWRDASGAAFDHLTEEEKEVWQRRVSVNSNSGVIHPLVHEHSISGRKSVYLHLGMTGAVLEMKKGIQKVDALFWCRVESSSSKSLIFELK